MCVGIPLRIVELQPNGLALCCDAQECAYATAIQTQLLDEPVSVGDWVLTHIDTAISKLSETEARQIADALQALTLATRGEDFEHLLGDLINREPQLPEHLRREHSVNELSPMEATK